MTGKVLRIDQEFLIQEGENEGQPPKHMAVYEAIRFKIITGEFAPGKSVTVRGLAKELDVSTTPIREALRRLVAEGALVMHANRRVSLPDMTESRFDELLDVRLLLEPAAAARSLPHIDDEIFKSLQGFDEAIDESIRGGVVSGYLLNNYQFHMTLYSAGPSQIFLPLIDSVWLQSCPFLRLMIGRFGTSNMVDYHVEALDAIKAGDEKRLIEAIRNDILEGMEIAREYTKEDAR